MDEERPKWNSTARMRARELLQRLYDVYAEQNDEASAAAIERAISLFTTEFFVPKKPKASEDDAQIRALFEQGLYPADIARQLHLDYSRVHDRLTRVMGYKVPTKRGRASLNSGARHEEANATDEEFLVMYKTGRTMEEIAAHYGVSRQRVHQRIKRLIGVTVTSTGPMVRAAERQVISVADDTDTWLKLIKKEGATDD